MLNVLIVDDEPLEREVLMDVVRKSKLGITKCTEAVNGAAAVDIINNQKVDIVMMDIKMPIMNGLSAAQHIKKKYPNMKIVFLTAYNEFDYALQTIKIGAEDYLLKPARPEEVIQALSKVINKFNQIIGNEGYEIPANSIVEVITTYINGNLHEKLTLEQLAGYVHLHPQYLGRLFKQEMHVTITEYITRKRIEKSKELLECSQKTITEISEICGFSDSNYFTRVFRKMEGIPPKEYRKNKQLLKREKRRGLANNMML